MKGATDLFLVQSVYEQVDVGCGESNRVEVLSSVSARLAGPGR